MKITSRDFVAGGEIPSKFTCDGENKLPDLEMTGFPADTKSLVLIIDDPDAPNGTFTHFVLFNIPITDNVVSCEDVVVSSRKGKNSAGDLEYRGMCPPSGTHRYFFKVYALDKMLDLPEGSSREEVENAMTPSVIKSGELMGTYSREKIS